MTFGQFHCLFTPRVSWVHRLLNRNNGIHAMDLCEMFEIQTRTLNTLAPMSSTKRYKYAQNNTQLAFIRSKFSCALYFIFFYKIRWKFSHLFRVVVFIVGNVRLVDCLAPWFCVHNLIFFFIRFYVDCIESLCDALNISPSPLIAFDVQNRIFA